MQLRGIRRHVERDEPAAGVRRRRLSVAPASAARRLCRSRAPRRSGTGTAPGPGSASSRCPRGRWAAFGAPGGAARRAPRAAWSSTTIRFTLSPGTRRPATPCTWSTDIGRPRLGRRGSARRRSTNDRWPDRRTCRRRAPARARGSSTRDLAIEHAVSVMAVAGRNSCGIWPAWTSLSPQPGRRVCPWGSAA